jgi:hypothetical protein
MKKEMPPSTTSAPIPIPTAALPLRPLSPEVVLTAVGVMMGAGVVELVGTRAGL